MKPTPKKEISVVLYVNNLLKIVAYTPDSQSWIREQGPEFGELTVSSPNEFLLTVYPVFDLDEVRVYLDGMEE